MLNIKKRLFKIIGLIVIIGILAGLNGGINLSFGDSTVRAVGDLTVNWGVPEGEPFFSVPNMAPGDIVSKDIEIYNGAISARPIGIRGKKTSTDSLLSDTLKIAISRNGQDLYGGVSPTGQKTLSQFFTDSLGTEGIELFTVNPDTASKITVKVSFDKDLGNEYQNKNVIFDIFIGIAVKVPEECKGIQFLGEPIFGTSSKDVIKGTSGNDLIFSFEGEDIVDAGDGDDCIVGGSGKDIIKGGRGNDVIFGDSGNDTIDGGEGDDLIYGGTGNDIINSGAGNDTIYGEEGNDTIEGGNGNDKIYGGTGDDILSGGSGDDYIQGDGGNDILSGGNNNDILVGNSGYDRADGGNGSNKCDAEVMVRCIKL